MCLGACSLGGDVVQCSTVALIICMDSSSVLLDHLIMTGSKIAAGLETTASLEPEREREGEKTSQQECTQEKEHKF